MTVRKLYLLTKKCKIIYHDCTLGRKDDVLAGMGDFTNTVTGLIPSVQFFSSAEFLTTLQTLLMAMTKPDIETIGIALHKNMIPALERLTGNKSLSWTTEEARSWADEIGYDGRDRAICMFGRGDGVCEKELRSRLSQGSFLIMFDPGETDLIDFRDELQNRIDFYRQESLIVCAHPLYQDIFKAEYAQFLRLINENRTRIMVNKNTMARFKENASKNVITNLPMLKTTNLVDDLGKILPSDVPVIIVAAGPSLDKNIEELKRAKGHCLIFAVDTAMKYLLAHDIIPDLGITIEPIKPMANYEDDRCFDVPHVFDSESNPEIVSKQRARTFIYNCRDYIKILLTALGKEVPPDVASGGSVATAAFAICYQLQMKRIIMIGQDLAYQGEATHAGGVESKGINNNIGYEMIDGIDGGKVRTRTDWLAYLKWFENAIALMKDEGYDMEVIDATEDGALIHGSRVMTLADAIDEYCVREYDFAKELEILPYLLDEKEWSRFGEQVKESGRELELVKDAAGKAIKLCQEVLDEDDTKDENRLKEVRIQLAGFRKTCEDAMLYPLINNYAVTEIADEVSRLRLEDSGPVSEIRQQKLAFEAIEGACGYFRKVMGERIGKKRE